MNPEASSVFQDGRMACQRAYQASLIVGTANGSHRTRGVQAFALALKQNQDEILEANTLDLEASREMAVPDLILDWIKLTPERLQATIQILERIAILPDPLSQLLSTNHPLEDSQSYCQRMPLGVVTFIYEGFPDLAAITAGMCLKAGNSLILKGGSEASHSNQTITQLLQGALTTSGFPPSMVEFLPADQGGSIRDLVTQTGLLQLIIPYGRPSLVQQVLRQATIPVLQTAIGNCYLYWSTSGSVEMAQNIILESHQGCPEAVNAIEKVLVHRQHPQPALKMLWKGLQDRGFELRGDQGLATEHPELSVAQDSEWSHPYLNRTIAFKTVSSLDQAIHWINQHSNGHADCIVTDSYAESRRFAQIVQSASTYLNTTSRFTRQAKQGDGVFLGMSARRGVRGGFIGLEALTTIKHVFQGNS
jgi:glutamate-5-semialdehyde dehydrogenase